MRHTLGKEIYKGTLLRATQGIGQPIIGMWLWNLDS